MNVQLAVGQRSMLKSEVMASVATHIISQRRMRLAMVLNVQ